MNRIVVLALMCLTTNAWSAWTFVTDTGTENRDFSVYVDLTTIKRNGDTVKIWYLHDFKNPRALRTGKSYRSSVLQEEYDCKTERLRTTASTDYSDDMGLGIAVLSDDDTGAWSVVRPRTIGHTKLKLACGQQ